MNINEVKAIARKYFPAAYVEEVGEPNYQVRPYKNSKYNFLFPKRGNYYHLSKKMEWLENTIAKNESKVRVNKFDSALNDQIEEHERLINQSKV